MFQKVSVSKNQNRDTGKTRAKLVRNSLGSSKKQTKSLKLFTSIIGTQTNISIMYFCKKNINCLLLIQVNLIKMKANLSMEVMTSAFHYYQIGNRCEFLCSLNLTSWVYVVQQLAVLAWIQSCLIHLSKFSRKLWDIIYLNFTSQMIRFWLTVKAPGSSIILWT